MGIPYYLMGLRHQIPKQVPVEDRPFDWRYQIMEMTPEERSAEINTWDREKVIYWLKWNDPNGLYTDQDLIDEGWEDLIFTLESAREYMINKLLEDFGDG